MKPYANRKLELSVDSGCVLWGARIIIPTSLRSVVLNELHEVPSGVVRMKSLACSFVWWPNLDHEIEQVIKECNGYQQQAYLYAKAPILHIPVMLPILGERISAIIQTQQRKQWLSVELNRWRSERIHCYFKNDKSRTLIIIM